MTANELADELTKMFRGEEYDRLVHEIPDLLRQQAKEIDELRESIKIKERDYNFMKDLAIGSENVIADKNVEIEALKPYKEKIEMMERAYDAHIKKSMGEVKDLIKKARKVK